MIKIKKPSINLLMGIIVGYLLALLVIAEISWIRYTISGSYAKSNGDYIGITSIIIAFITFLFVIKIFKKIKFNKLNLYFIFVITASIFITTEVSLGYVYIIDKVTINIRSEIYTEFLESNIGSFIVMNFILLNFILLIGVFLVSFTLLINRKVKYIKYITKEIKKIEDEGFGKTIKIKGNDELSDLTKSINRMSSKIKEKNDQERLIEKNKNELITNVSHDLRTPLTSMIGYIDLIKKDEFKDKEKLSEYIDIIDERTKSLNSLINELFEYTKLNSHDIKLNYSEVEIVGLIEQIVGEYISMFNREGLELEKNIIDSDIIVTVDIEKIVRAIENLLINSMKYSVARSKVIVKLEEKEEGLIFSISNETENIKEEDLDNIFERFYKVDKSRKESESTGLGLSIVKRIVELHEGTIKVELVNNIITFEIIIPYKRTLIK